VPDECTPKLEFSPDPLNDTTPTYTDVTAYLKEASWNSGVSRDLDQPQAGGATFVLRNRNRDWEPEYAAGRFAGNILPLRRFRWSITADGVSRPQGTYYATSYQVVYPDPSSTESDVVVTCVDGFGVLSLYPLPRLDSGSTAETYADVIMADEPFAYYPVNDGGGKTMSATAGPQGVYKNTVEFGHPSPVVGSNDLAAQFTQTGYARALLDDSGIWFDSGELTVECVVQRQNSFLNNFVGGPWDTTAANRSFGIDYNQMFIFNTGATLKAVNFSGGALGAGTYHLALTYDGSTLRAYINGVLDVTDSGAGTLINPDTPEFVYIGWPQNHSTSSTIGVDIISNVAFYTHALSADRVAAHSTAALSRGYAAQTAGSRIAALATHPIWSTASIPAGTVVAAPRFQVGQEALDEIVTTAATETPQSLFFFNDAGNPDYIAWEDTTTIQATLGEQEVQYDDIGLVYDDQVFNQATAGREGGATKTASDAASQAAYSVRAASDLTGLILANDADAAMISQAIVDHFGQPMYRFESVVLNGAQQNRRTQILVREIGDTIRIKRRGAGGTANPDIVTRIIGKEKHVDVNKHLTCSWTLARGFSAATATWHLSQSGYAELNTTAILA